MPELECPHCASDNVIVEEEVEWYGWKYIDLLCQSCGCCWEEHYQDGESSS